jgi:outer membrane protein assembly factor BamB
MAQLADTPWPCSGGNAQRTGLSKYDTSHVDGTLLWEMEIPGSILGNIPLSSNDALTLGKNNTLYVATFVNANSFDETTSTLYAVDLHQQTMKAVFSTEPGEAIIIKAPTIAEEGTMYLPSYHYPREALLYALDSNYKLLWTFNAQSRFLSSPMLDAQGTIYTCSSYPGNDFDDEYPYFLYAIQKDGTQKWSTTIRPNKSGVTLDKSGNIYIAGGRVNALNPEGETLWTYSGSDIGPMISPDGSIYVAKTYEGELHALDSKGNMKWVFHSDKTSVGEASVFSIVPSLGPDGTVYLFSCDNRRDPNNMLYAVDPMGKLKWKFRMDSIPESNIAIGAEGNLYFTNSDKMMALNSEGQVLWSYEDERIGSSDIVIGSDGRIYLCSHDSGKASTNSTLFAFGEKDELISKAIEKDQIDTAKPEATQDDTQFIQKESSSWEVLFFLAPVVVILIALGILRKKRGWRKSKDENKGR